MASIVDFAKGRAKLTITTQVARASWRSRDRYGPTFFRVLSGDFDVETGIVVPASARPGNYAGLLCQDEAPALSRVAEGEEAPAFPASTWLAWLTQESSGSRRLLFRSTPGSVSVDAPTANTDAFLRMKRAGPVFTLYSRPSETQGWTQRAQIPLTLPAAVRIGLVVGADDRSTVAFTARFAYVRFTGGGLPRCKLTWEDCDLHGNTVQFNGWREMPDGHIST